MSTQSTKGKFILAALAGAAAGGAIVALSTRAVPRMMSEMEAMCKQMMASMKDCGCEGTMRQRAMAGTEQAAEHTACTACES